MNTNQTVRRVDKPWGYELIWAETAAYVGKILHVKKGHRLSLQYHQIKEETMFLLSGRVTLVYENDKGQLEEIDMKPGQAQHIQPLRKHRLVAVEDSDMAEVSTPHLGDVVRLEDTYGREGTSKP